MNEHKTLVTIFLAIITSCLVIFTSLEIYDRYQTKQAMNAIEEAANKFQNEINEKNEKLRQQKIAKEKALEEARKFALVKKKAELERKKYLAERSHGFELWYEKNKTEECKEEAYGELNVDCINKKMRAKTQFISEYK